MGLEFPHNGHFTPAAAQPSERLLARGMTPPQEVDEKCGLAACMSPKINGR